MADFYMEWSGEVIFGSRWDLSDFWWVMLPVGLQYALCHTIKDARFTFAGSRYALVERAGGGMQYGRAFLDAKACRAQIPDVIEVLKEHKVSHRLTATRLEGVR